MQTLLLLLIVIPVMMATTSQSMESLIVSWWKQDTIEWTLLQWLLVQQGNIQKLEAIPLVLVCPVKQVPLPRMLRLLARTVLPERSPPMTKLPLVNLAPEVLSPSLLLILVFNAHLANLLIIWELLLMKDVLNVLRVLI
jgi:hypothetical protein